MKYASAAANGRAGASTAPASQRLETEASTVPEGFPPVVGQDMTSASARVAKALLESGAATVSDLAKQLYLTPTAVRRHLDSLVHRGFVTCSTDAPFGPHRARGRGRPARYYSLTPLGRDAFDAGYADVALDALRFLADRAGEDAVRDFAVERTTALEERYRPLVEGAGTARGRAQALAGALTSEGFAATTEDASRGTQLCQHHCPITHVAAEYPQFCDAEQEAFSRLLGVHVTRLATIAAGGGVCTTLIPDVPQSVESAAPRPSPQPADDQQSPATSTFDASERIPT
jgi:predicted ArsR family transcriptional regulator